MSFTFVDLFAGCGGLSLGLIEAGGTGLLAVEKNEDAFDTLHTNLCAPSGTLAGFDWAPHIDARAFGIKELLSKYDDQLEKLAVDVDVVAGGPPCQGFSVYGRRDPDDDRNSLYLDYLKAVEKLKPSVVLLENVTGIDMVFEANESSDRRRDTVAYRIVRRLHGLGYQTGTFSLCASDFGVPQYRRRFFVVAVRTPRDMTDVLDDDFLGRLKNQYLLTLGLNDGQKVSVRQAIGDLEIDGQELIECIDMPNRLQIQYKGPRTRYQKEMHADMPRNYAPSSMRLAKHGPTVEDKFRLIQETGTPGKRIDVEMREQLQLSKHRTHLLDGTKPSVTVTTLPDDFVHYSEPRILTVRELARLQSFPDWFGFCGPYTSGGDRRIRQCPRYTQVGNAVPVRLARFMGLYVAEILNNIRTAEGYRLAA